MYSPPDLTCASQHMMSRRVTGTGKTATFAVSILQKIDASAAECQALVLAPTRELAQQIVKVVRALGDFMQLQVRSWDICFFSCSRGSIDRFFELDGFVAGGSLMAVTSTETLLTQELPRVVPTTRLQEGHWRAFSSVRARPIPLRGTPCATPRTPHPSRPSLSGHRFLPSLNLR